MTIEKSPRFKDELEVIVDFIAKDSVNRALAFYDELLVKINQIPDKPYIHRKRFKLNDENVRELVFIGYTIPYEIDKTNNKIIILGIFNQNLWL
ncbi:type II toxin-antitoxin system RelE/ParE family toxin [Sulfurimonas sp. NWX79]|uniref:type II toxin-antitoxin system RelE/ParE family toxin n=1 Tax=Sulfurimonas sp. NWX79 TaxID=2925412 RepID=UPI0032049D9F